jgi:hypothetical protein
LRDFIKISSPLALGSIISQSKRECKQTFFTPHYHFVRARAYNPDARRTWPPVRACRGSGFPRGGRLAKLDDLTASPYPYYL